MRPVVVVLAVALAACSGADEEAQRPQTTTSAAAPTITQPATTDVRLYSPWNDGLRKQPTKKGQCDSGSSFAMRSDAWRCIAEDSIHDPCFSDPTEPGARVACPASPEGDGIVVLQVATLPFDSANAAEGTSGTPWALKLADGKQCRIAGGATIVVADQRLNYHCQPELGLFGDPERHQDRAWKIFAAPQGATQLTQVDIAIAWF